MTCSTGYTLKHLKEGGYSMEQVIKARMNGNVYAGYPWQDVFMFWSSGEDILVLIRRRNEQPNECAPFLIGSSSLPARPLSFCTSATFGHRQQK